MPDVPRVARPAVGYALTLAAAALLRRQRHGVDAGPGGRASRPTRLTALRCTGAALVLLVVLAVVAPGPAADHLARGPVPRRLRRRRRRAHPVPLLRGDRPDAGRDRAGLRDDRAGVHRALRLAGAAARRCAAGCGLALLLSLSGLVLVAEVWQDGGSLDPVGVGGRAGRGALPGHLLPDGRARHGHPRPGDAHLLELRGGGGLLVGGRALVAVRRRACWPSGCRCRSARWSCRSWVLVAWIVVLGAVVPFWLSIAALRHLRADHRRAGRDGRAGVRLDRRLAVAGAGAHRLAGRRRRSSSSPGSCWRRPRARRPCRPRCRRRRPRCRASASGAGCRGASPPPCRPRPAGRRGPAAGGARAGSASARRIRGRPPGRRRGPRGRPRPRRWAAG